jgi:hypothetical protein
MAKGLDEAKRQAWVARLERFRASGQTIAKFCDDEKVSVQTYYYWVRRIAAPATPTRATSRSAPGSTVEKHAIGSRVCFQFGGGVKVWVPADCLEAIRCLAQCIGVSLPAPPASFHQVLVGGAAREAG